jgi:hypothetical protein
MCGRNAWEFGRQIGFLIGRKQQRIIRPTINSTCPSGFNAKRYGYPDPIRDVVRETWNAAPISKSRENCNRLKRLCSFKSIPSREKVQDIIAILGGKERFEPFMASHNWLEIDRCEDSESELYDISVPVTGTFLASGTVNHNTRIMAAKVVRHCYENDNALGFVLTSVRSMSEDGGAWHKLLTEVLPEWEDGLGLVWKRGVDKQHNDLVWIFNQHGTWSQIKGISAPHPEQLRERFPGREPSIVFVDELTMCSTIEYFTAPSAQLSRRPGVRGVQQYLGACNPAGQSHWVYKLFFEDAFNEETGVWNKDFATFYMPLTDNERFLPPDYLPRLRETYKHDPIEAARLIGGEWRDRPSGEALFKEIYSPVNHVRPLDADGRPKKNERLLPVAGYPIAIGLDPGSVYNAFVFTQWVPVDGVWKWVVFDEVVTIRKRISYEDFIPIIIRRLKFWRDQTKTDHQTMPVVMISDSSAFNMFRAAQGSFDVLEIERIWEAARGKYGIESVKIKNCPKFNGSVIARVRLCQKLLSQDNLIVSAGCPFVQKMFLTLEAQKQKQGEPFDPDLALTPKRSDMIHTFDALSYVILHASTNPTALIPSSGDGMTLIRVA